MARASEIDRLIEEGLHRYGSGDLDGALLSWERALAIDPGNSQANSYVDYVRMNYEALAERRLEPGEEGAPLPLHELPEYKIDTMPAPQRPSGPLPQLTDALDHGWAMEEETHENERTAEVARSSGEIPLDDEAANSSFELEAEEPPGVQPARAPSSPGISFDDATREYANREQILSPEPGKEDFAGGEQPTTEFRHEETPNPFAPEGTPSVNHTTQVKKRDLGFVRAPSQGDQPPAERTRPDKPSAPMAIGHAPTMDLGAAGGAKTLTQPPASSREKTAELDKPPVLRPITKDFPGTNRAPARDVTAVSQAEVMLPHVKTRDLDLSKTTPPRGSKSSVPPDDPLIGQPTRDLGLRPAGRPPSVSDEEPTRESDARAIREQVAARGRAKASARPPTDSTRHDIALPFDPIEQRAAEILDEIDVEVPAGEAPEDRTRRRLGALFERALAYHQGGEVERAVVAIDLALSEDSTTALAQKLIHRNRDTIMAVFQGYLGDLERQPQLARPLHELASSGINPRAAFLLSRIDGTLTIDEILDVSGMPRLEAYRYLCQLFLRGILK